MDQVEFQCSVLVISVMLSAAPLTIARAEADAARLTNTVPATPTISISSPHDGAVFNVSSNTVVEIEGGRVGNVGHIVRLFDGSALVQSVVLDAAPAKIATIVPFKFDLAWSHLTAGRHVLTATIDETASDPVNVVLKPRRHARHSSR